MNVTAAVDPAISSAGPVAADLAARTLPDVLARHPGVAWPFQGAQAEQADAVGGLQRDTERELRNERDSATSTNRRHDDKTKREKFGDQQ